MKRFTRITSLILLLVVLTTQMVYGQESTATATSTEVNEQVPSPWAIWDIQMAYTYGLGNNNSYQRYNHPIIGREYLRIESSFEEKFGIEDQTKVEEDHIMTRGEVIIELFDIVKLALNLDSREFSDEDALYYLVANGIISGRSNADYALNQLCTNEELLVISKRVYDHLTYRLGLDAKGAFWKVSDEDNTVYLLGSIHATDGSVYPMSKEIITAYNSSDFLVVEANILTPEKVDTAYIQQKMILEGDTTIDQLISEETYNAYAEVMINLGVQPEIYDRFKPWYAAMVLQSINMASSSYDASLGIDLYFLSQAQNIKPIIELEGIKFQIDMFDSFSVELQEGYLWGVLQGEETTNDTIDAMLTYWKSGDMQALEKLVFAEEGTTDIEKEFNEKVWETRNEHMTKEVDKMLTTDVENDYFVVVGAGHMLNHNGIVNSLIEQGYIVEQIK